MNATSGHPIRAVARMTGLGIDTLRAWERRYRAVVPQRSERGRLYSHRDVDRLKQLAALIAEGHAIGAIASLPDRQLRRLRSAGDDGPRATASQAIDLAPLFRAVKQYDLAAIDALLNRHALLLPPADLIFSVILPMLRDIGERWESGTISPAQEHLVSAVVRGVLGALLRSLPRAAGAPLIFATPAGERHELGLLCGAVLAAASGRAVIYLGPDLPASEIAAATRRAQAKTLVLATTVVAPDVREIKAFKRVPEGVAMWVGGARGVELKRAIGSRARLVDSLDALRSLVDGHAT